MKTLFIEARKKLNREIDKINFEMLPEKIDLAYSIQYKELADKIKTKLGKRVASYRQVLGCSEFKPNHPILLVGSGRFHAINLALQGNLVYVLEGNAVNRIDEEEISKIKLRRKAALSKFFSSNSIGILISLKPGQERLKKAFELREKLRKKGKKAWIFLSDCINFDELENYNIESWVNTACPALSFDSRIINLSELV